MSRNYYSELHLHMVWHTKSSLPLLTPQIEPFVHRYLKQRLINTPGAFVHEIGGIETHVHVVVTIAPTILISDLIGQLKGSSAHETNRQFPGRKVLVWQGGYGVVGFGTKDLEWVKADVHHQREHHARGTVFERLERITADDGAAPAEAEQREAPFTGLRDCMPSRSPAVNGGPSTRCAGQAPLTGLKTEYHVGVN